MVEYVRPLVLKQLTARGCQFESNTWKFFLDKQYIDCTVVHQCTGGTKFRVVGGVRVGCSWMAGHENQCWRSERNKLLESTPSPLPPTTYHFVKKNNWNISNIFGFQAFYYISVQQDVHNIHSLFILSRGSWQRTKRPCCVFLYSACYARFCCNDVWVEPVMFINVNDK